VPRLVFAGGAQSMALFKESNMTLSRTHKEAQRHMERHLPAGTKVRISGSGPFNVWLHATGTPKEVLVTAPTLERAIDDALEAWMNWNGQEALHLACLAKAASEVWRTRKRLKAARRFQALTWYQMN
jgi:hypothetical protein